MPVIGDYIKVKHGYAFKGDYISTEDNDIVLVTPGNFAIGGGFKEQKCKFFTSEYPDEYVLKEDDLIVTMTDLSKAVDTLGYSALVPFSDKRVYLHNQRIGLVQILSNEIDKHYLYWYMRTPKYQRFIAATSSGSTVHHTSPDRICEVEIEIPKMEVQKKIARFLDDIEAKININENINRNLSEQAEILFKSWFEEFEPWNGDRPENWTEGVLGDFVTIKRGGSPRPIQEFLSNEGLRWLKISDVSGLQSPYVLDIAEHIIEAGLKKTVHLDEGSLVLSNSATPGIPKILDVDSCIHDGWLYFPESQLSNYYLYLFCKSIRPKLVALGNGSVFTNLKTDILKGYSFFKPDDDTLRKFDELVTPMFETMREVARENQHLSELRESLLPKLILGELDVSDLAL